MVSVPEREAEAIINEESHMNLLSATELKTLIANQSRPCISMFLPTKRAGSESRENSIRLKNLIKKAEEYAVAKGIRKVEAKQYLKPAREILQDHQLTGPYISDGLALFMSPELYRCYSLPLPLEEFVVLSDNFHIKPLLPVVLTDRTYYVLALSQKKVRLLQCTRNSVREVELKNVPTSLDEALKYDVNEKSLQHHTGTGDGKAVFHSQGSTADEAIHKKEILQFLLLLDRGLAKVLSGNSSPLALAGVEYLCSLFRGLATYRNILDKLIPGNPDEKSNDKLHKEGLDIVEPIFRESQERARAHYNEHAGNHLAISKLEDVLPAAYGGRIETIFIPSDVHIWGTFDSESGAVKIHDREEPGDEDLSDMAAVHTLLHKGSAFAVERQHIPGGGHMAAVLRY